MVEKTAEEKEIFKKGYYGFLMVIIGPITFFYFKDLMEFIIQQNMKLKEGDIIVENWSNPPMGIYAQIYMFNITNPDDVPQGKVPVLKEVGPFVMQLRIKKLVYKWNKDAESLEYKQKLAFFVEDKLSDKSVNETIYLLNMPAVGAASLLKESGLAFLTSGIFNSIMEEETLIQKTTVRGLIAEGLKVQFLDSLTKKPFLSFLKDTFDAVLKNGTVNILYLMNRTEPMKFEVATGYKDGYSMGEVLAFEGQRKMSKWGNEYCDMINGSGNITFHYINHFH
ncbi:sensory neuron membrane protein 2-like [Centruroides sculpturatus]|uniref:sensory neuron membrane protein 2-like n=1 Tax=Centruroides sculpturatus TaxID=218467 RepID=UPI000C6DDEEE|nr:sensory neuron membrane protein 2-like [Centruroides sculpturatus]